MQHLTSPKQHGVAAAGDPNRAVNAVSGPMPERAPLLCLSHLRWEFVFQRPQHLMTRWARVRTVIFFEEPVVGDEAHVEVRERDGVLVATPHLPAGLDGIGSEATVRALLDGMLAERGIAAPALWYYTPMAWAFSEHLTADAPVVVYDCMDELSAFRFAPPALIEREKALLARADVVFTGGHSLYEAKRSMHGNVHPFPSSVDVPHFAGARARLGGEPDDQAGIAHPRVGFCGVIDERMDIDLLREVATARPNVQFVMIGPVVKIDPATLPQLPNIHYLGGRPYPQLPRYFAGWNAAMMPFARNESTRFISPTKTPEYLAAGLPVVSTPITDVVRHYGDLRAVRIAGDAAAFAAAIDGALALTAEPEWLQPVDEVLAATSWDQTWHGMDALLHRAQTQRASSPPISVVTSLTSSRGSVPARRERGFDYLVVGAGFAGSILAERLARDAGKRVLVVDRRPHIAGNAYDCYDAAGILIHRYGPHIFHTNSRQVVDYLSQFTAWRPYEHRVLAATNGMLVPIPINRTTINKLYGLDLCSQGVERFLADRAEPMHEVLTAEDAVVAKVGRELYDRFFKGYTSKMWGISPTELDRSVTARIPTRTDDDDRYFTDQFQMMPLHGYTRMFENMLDHPNIKVMLQTDYTDVEGDVVYDHLIYTGTIDDYFDQRFGPLPYRSLRFEHETHDRAMFQPVGVVNYPSGRVPFTRVTEYKHLTGQQHARTSISYEFPSADGDPYYPVPRPENQATYKRYQELADSTPNVTFVGRLATYRYYNMDQVVGQALATYARMSVGQSHSQHRPAFAEQAVA